MMSTILLTLTALTIIATNTASSLQCFDCNVGRFDALHRCHDPLNKTLNPIIKEEYCNSQQNACVFIQKQYSVERRCVVEQMGGIDYCHQKQNEPGHPMEKCVLCSSSFCNSFRTTPPLTCYNCNAGKADEDNRCHDPLNTSLNPIVKEEACASGEESCLFLQRESNVERRCVKKSQDGVAFCQQIWNENGDIEKCELCNDNLCNSRKSGAVEMIVSTSVLAGVAAVLYANC